MALSTIYSTDLSTYRPVVWYGKAVYTHASQLISFLKSNLGEEYGNLFAEPHIPDDAITGVAKAHWLSAHVSSNAKPLNQFGDAEQRKIREQLSAMLNNIEQLSDKLQKSGEKNKVKWAEILQTVIEIPSLDHVFVENQKIVLVCWGFTSDKTETEKFQLKKAIVQEIPDTNEDNNELPTIDTAANDNTNTDTVDEPKKDEKVNYIKKYWWIVLLIALLILVLCYIFSNKKNQHLPEKEAIIPPIDTTKIIKNPDGNSVISNQLNLWLTNDSTSIEHFADAFKKQYPDDNYKIVYFNKTLKRVRIEFPDSEKKNLKEQLKTQFPEYNLIIFDEAILKQNFRPQDPGFSDKKKSWAYEMIKAYQAWDINKGKPEVIVAIIDDGFDLSHPEFAGKIVNPFNVPLNNTSPNTGRTNMSHGTHVAGSAIGNMANGAGVSGVAPNCSFMPVQVGDPYGNMSTTAIIDAVLYCVSNGANVVNMSLGTPAPSGLSKTKQSTQKDLIENTYKEQEKLWNEIFAIADKSNVTVVLAGGNDDVLIGIGSMGRTPFTINVSALDANMQKASFSNYGEFSTVSAPGVQIYSSVPSNKYAFYDGTSMAAPIVTGAVALLKSQNPALTTSEIKKILKKTGIKINNPDKYCGELIQLDVALKYASGETPDIVDCPEIQDKIDSLRREIDKLKELCDSGYVDNNDEELIIPDNPKDLEFAEGRWKSSSDLHNINTNEAVELYFDFKKDGTGKLTLKEADGNLCYAGLNLSMSNKTLDIIQTEGAKCNDGIIYEKYVFQCVQTGTSAAQCKAKSKANKNIISFTLKRVY